MQDVAHRMNRAMQSPHTNRLENNTLQGSIVVRTRAISSNISIIAAL